MHLIVNTVSQLQVDNRHFKLWMPIKNIQKGALNMENMNSAQY